MIKITGTANADTVAVAIHALGFTPTSSVVLILLEHHTVAATLRIDAHPEDSADSWAAKVTTYVDRLKSTTGVLLLSFEDDRAMTPAQYRALDTILARTGRPVRHALLIRDGYITDYENQTKDKVSFDMLATSNAALALMVATKRYVKFAADISHCSNDTAVSELQGFKEAARWLDCENRTTRSATCTRLIGIVTGGNLEAHAQHSLGGPRGKRVQPSDHNANLPDTRRGRQLHAHPRPDERAAPQWWGSWRAHFRILDVDGSCMRIQGQTKGPRRSGGGAGARFDSGDKTCARLIVRGRKGPTHWRVSGNVGRWAADKQRGEAVSQQQACAACH